MSRVRRVRVLFRFPYMMIIFWKKLTLFWKKLTITILRLTFSDEGLSLFLEKVTFSLQFSREFIRKGHL